MNLIEQLGGYSIAITEYKMSIKLLNIDYEQLARELLEYRRANNIFELGDLVVFSDYFMHDEIMTISQIDGCEMWMDDGAKWTHNFNEMIRHAESQEIKEGKRL